MVSCRKEARSSRVREEVWVVVSGGGGGEMAGVGEGVGEGWETSTCPRAFLCVGLREG